MQVMKKIVFFDLDGTILPNPSSEKRFFFWLLMNGQIGLKQIWEALKYSFQRLCSFKNHVFVTNKAYLTGLSVTTIEKFAKDYSQKYLLPDVRLVLKNYIAQHQQAGDIIVLLTATLEYIANVLAKNLEISNVIATKCAIKDGVFCCQSPLQLPYAATKLTLAEKFCKNLGYEIKNAVAYGNSSHDLFLLKSVGEAIAVTPDRKLRKIAKASGWKIID
jgi:phosphoserine phosphatase